MPRNIFVVNNPDRWPLRLPEVEVVSARTYLTDPTFSTERNCRVYNLLRSYAYQSLGYYVSLLAEARGHKPMPRIAAIQDLRYQSLARVISADLNALIQKALHHIQGDEFTLSIYFSRNVARRYDKLARRLFNLFPMPLLRAEFRRSDGTWELHAVNAISSSEIPESHRPAVMDLAREHFARVRTVRARKTPRFSLGILADKRDPTPPSNARALERFADAAGKLGFSVDFLDREDYGRVAQFDALFIRSTTAVNNYTYRFARRAEAEGLAVIDDTESIVKCTNKVFLAELLARHRIAMPRTEILHRDNVDEVMNALGFPLVLKQPDSSFSLGVVKVSSADECRARVDELLEESDMLIAQEFLRTDFDWRIGVIDRKPLYACQYFMARDHWQIYDNSQSGDDKIGDFITVPLEDVPASVVRTAVRAANLIGDGLYGVDLKQTRGRSRVIEINDNPNIDAGVEDEVLKRKLYDTIMQSFVRRIEARREGG